MKMHADIGVPPTIFALCSPMAQATTGAAMSHRKWPCVNLSGALLSSHPRAQIISARLCVL
jgi:hypothetical protein